MRNAAEQWLANYNGEKFIELDAFQHAARRHLISRAATTGPAGPMGARITYGDLGDQLDPGKRRCKGQRRTHIGHDLGCISQYEHEHGRPLPSSIVVLALTGQPAGGFVKDLCKGTLKMTVPEGSEYDFWRGQVGDEVP
jgi:hypothetical protein